LLTALLAPWLWLRCQITIHSDILWLSEALKRVLAGGLMQDVAYELNPPLSLLIYSAPVLMEAYTGLPLHIGVIAQTFLIFVMCLGLFYALLKKTPGLDDASRLCLVAGYVVATTLLSAFHFGQRDHLIAMALPPFVLMQVAITQRRVVPGIGYTLFLALGSVMILMKPHFGLISLILLAHRFKLQRNFSLLGDRDFLALTFTTLGYGAVVWFGFRDYIDVIVPDVLRYYYLAADNNNVVSIVALSSVVIGALYALTYAMGEKQGCVHFIRGLILASIACMGVVLLQNKGFYYHYLPAMVFFVSACGAVFYDLALQKIKNQAVALFGVTIALVALAYICIPLPLNHPRHSGFAEIPLAQEVMTETSGRDVPAFFLFNNNMGLIHELAYYTNTIHSSRFPNLWFLPGLMYYEQQRVQGHLGLEDAARSQRDYQRYGDMLAEDLNRYRPTIVWLISPQVFDGKIDLIAFFSSHENFMEAWSYYQYERTVEIHNDVYKKGARLDTLTPFLMYRRSDVKE
jgi:hypothetical protein